MKLSFYYIQQSIFRETSIIPSYKKNPLELSLPRCTYLPFVLQCVVSLFVHLFQTWANPSKAQLCLCAVKHSSGQCWSDEISFSSAVVGKCKSKREDQSSCFDWSLSVFAAFIPLHTLFFLAWLQLRGKGNAVPKCMPRNWCDREKGYNPSPDQSSSGGMRNIPHTVITQGISRLMALCHLVAVL